MSKALGRYELLSTLARGGMAEVFLARRRTAGLEKLFVVKRIRSEREGDVRFLELFVREARLSMHLTHQNIVQVFDFGRTGDQVFLAMEHVEGRDLGSTLHRGGHAKPLSPLIAAYVAAECCQALDYAHQRKRDDGAPLGVVHRDVTPRNVLLSWSGEVKLTDFGIAALAGDETSTVVGTPGYMAPEQARGEPVDARADVFAIGMVLREALTGERPRVGADRAALVDAARHGAMPPWPSGFGGPLVAIIDRATARRADDRYPDARSMLADLDAFIVGERASHRGEAPARQLAAWLTDVWGAPRDEAAPASVAGAVELVSFLDDDVMGSGTDRSLAATAAVDMAPAARVEPPALEPALEPPALEPSALEPPAQVIRPTRRRRARLAATATAAAIGLGVVIAMALGRPADRGEVVQAGSGAVIARSESALPKLDERRVEPRSPASAGSLHHGPGASVPVLPAVLAPPPQLAPLPARTPQPSTPLAPPPPPTPSTQQRGQASRPALTRPLPRHQPPPEPVAPAPVARRQVRINARPWAVFSVDDQPTRYETIHTLELAPGPHRIRFSNPQLRVEREVTIVVPADRDLDHVEDLRR